MGLFSSEYKTTVGTSVSRVVQDNTIIASSKTGLIAGLFGKAGDQLVENVLENMVAGMGVRAERMYNYARDNYTYGLPSAQVFTTADGKAVVLGVIEAQAGTDIFESYYHFGPLNNLHVAWVTLFNDYGYNSVTNQIAVLSSQIGYPVYLNDMQVIIKEATLAERTNGSLDQFGVAARAGYTPRRAGVTGYYRDHLSSTPFKVDPSAVDDSVYVSYTWKGAGGVIHDAGFSIPITGFDLTQDYFQVKYRTATNEGYWMYRLGEGTHPEIDTIFDAIPDSAGEFFPIIYFRQGTTNMGTDKEAPGYKTSNRMMDILGINYMDIINAVHQSPSIAQVEQAMMMFAVPANTTNQVEQQYLFDFFDKLYLAGAGIGVGVGWETPVVGDPGTISDETRLMYNVNRLMNYGANGRIRVSIHDTRLTTGLSCDSIYKRKRAGTVAAVGSYTSVFATEIVTSKYVKREIIGYSDLYGYGDPIYGDVVYPYDENIDVFIYKHQITDAVYEEIHVFDLRMTYYMWGGYYTVGDDLSPILLVPLDRSITKNYGVADRELLYTRSMHFVFNSRVVTEVEWYQQGWFGDLLMVAAIIVTVVSLGADGGLTMQLAAVAAGTITVEAFAMYIAMAIIEQVAIMAALKLFVQAVGVDIAFFAAVFAALYGGYEVIKAGSLKGAPWAKELLTYSSNLGAAVSSAIAEAMDGLKKESDAFNLLAKEKTELLDNANKLLEQQTLLSPLVIFGESPDDFYNRTVHSGNIGILGIDSIASYVDIALTLPKFNDSIGSNNHALSV